MRTAGLFFVIVVPILALAHQPVIIDFERYEDTFVIEDVDLSQAFYGDLTGFPHTYSFTLTEPTEFYAQVLVPDIAEIETDRSAIIVRQLERGGVEEVVRLSAADAKWESFYEPFAGDSYLEGPEWRAELEAGEYLLEVSTPDNYGKYTLSTGELEDFSNLGYFETISRIYQVKKFFGKPGIAIFQSPLFTVPFVLLLIVLFVGYRFYKKRQRG